MDGRTCLDLLEYAHHYCRYITVHGTVQNRMQLERERESGALLLWFGLVRREIWYKIGKRRKAGLLLLLVTRKRCEAFMPSTWMDGCVSQAELLSSPRPHLPRSIPQP